MSYALNAPYLISATTQSDSFNISVQIQWRNNDVATTGFIIQRKISSATNYEFLDSIKSATMLTYTSTNGLLQATIYDYQVIAYSATETSDTSNSAQVTTLRIAPYPKTIFALSRYSVMLTWQDNGKATGGFILQRKDSTETLFHFVDSLKSATILTYTDSIGLQPGTLYTYRVIAYDALDVQDTSKNLQVTTKQDVFTVPTFSAFWNFQISSSVLLTISDKSNCEIGYRIYRSDGLNSSLNLVATIISSNPDTTGPIIWNDNSVSINQWHSYKVAAYKNDSSIYSGSDSIYTFHSVPMNTKVVFQKLSDFPITLSGFSAKAGDSIILKESSAPAEKYSVINVNDPANPQFDGYTDSTVLVSYPQQTLIPAFLQFGVYNSETRTRVIQSKDKMLVSDSNGVKMYQIQNSNLVFSDSFMVSSKLTMRQIFLLNDTLLSVNADTSYSISISYPTYNSGTTDTSHYLYLIKLSNAGFSSFPRFYIPDRDYHYWQMQMGNGVYDDYSGFSYIHGWYNDAVIISVKQLHSHITNTATTRDSSASVVAVNEKQGFVSSSTDPSLAWPNASTSNTGYYLSPTENLCTAGPSLFVADIRDLPDGYQTALANNAVYQWNAADTLKNILLDTLNKRVYLFYLNKLSILSYQHEIVGASNLANKHSILKGISIIPNASRSGVTIVLPSTSRNADLFIYDLSGRVVDKMQNIASNAVFWRPKTKSMACYIAMVKANGQTHTMKFMAR